MIKLALAMGFMAVFGLVAWALVYRITRIEKEKATENKSNNLNNQTK
jgi:hypothetical protein